MRMAWETTVVLLDEITPLRITKEYTDEYADGILTVVFFD